MRIPRVTMDRTADDELMVAVSVNAWARCVGISDRHALQLAIARATAASRGGASVADATTLARELILSWVRHPAHSGPPSDLRVA